MNTTSGTGAGLRAGTTPAEQSMVQARLDELAAVYPLPAPLRRGFRPAEALGGTSLSVPPSVHLWLADAAAVAAWAAQLGIPLGVEVYDHNGRIWRVTRAVGDLAGWRLFLGEALPPTWRPVPQGSLLRAAREGWL